MEFYFTD